MTDYFKQIEKLSNAINELEYCKQMFIAAGNEQADNPPQNDIIIDVNGCVTPLFDSLDAYDTLIQLLTKDLRELITNRYVNSLLAFRRALDEQLEQNMAILETEGGTLDYNCITLEFNGCKLKVPFNADTYEHFCQLTNDEIDEAKRKG